jgi:uncharacterized Zn finger protein
MLGNGLWFDPRALQRLVDDATWSRGLMLYRNQQVLSLDIEPGFGGWVLLGEVQGSQREPYELSVELKLTRGGQLVYWDSDCSCPVGNQCKHGVALTLKAAYQGLRLLDGDAGVESAAAPTPEQVEAARQAELARKAELGRLEAEAQLLGWLQALDRAQHGRSALATWPNTSTCSAS